MNKRRISEIKQQEEEYERAIAQQNNRIYLLEKTKLEEELTLKSKELSEVTLNNIAHQEFLEMLKSEIKEHKKTGTEHKKFLDIL